MSKQFVSVEGLSKVYPSKQQDTVVFEDVNIGIDKGEFVCIVGHSGCGKSTLLSLLGLLDTSSGGNYTLNGHEVADINSKQRAAIRNKEIGFVFQSFNLISELTVAENVALPLTYRKDIPKTQRHEMVTAALEKVDMAHRTKHYPSQLSGGQQQRVAVARAIAGNPSIILADEPTGNLDSKNAELVMSLLDKLHAEGATICMVTHDPRGAKRAERIIEVFDGRIVSDSIVNSDDIEEAVA